MFDVNIEFNIEFKWYNRAKTSDNTSISCSQRLPDNERSNGHVRVNCGVKAIDRQADRQTESETENGTGETEAYRQTSSLVRAVSSFSIWYVLLHLLIDALVAGCA